MKAVHRFLALLLITTMVVPMGTISAAGRREHASTVVEKNPAQQDPSSTEEGTTTVRVVGPEGLDLSKYGTFVPVRVPDVSGQAIYYGVVAADRLDSLVADRRVSRVDQVTERVPVPDTHPDPDVPGRERPTLEETRARLVALRDNPPPPTRQPRLGAWWDVQPDGHDAVGAWEAGYTGDGVVVAVNDSGVDMAHADFWGTEARYTNVSGDPYLDYFDGWPMALSPFSNWLMAYDLESAGELTAGNTFYHGASTFADTRTTGVGPTISFDGRTYTTSGTASSANPVYHIGYHPDRSLRDYVWGTRIGVLVVDEDGDGVYDTVYVDLNNNRDFRDDKPVRKDTNPADDAVQGADELSWWDADGDGYPDVSGGMLYFIADGQHCPPFFDVYFGCWANGTGWYAPPGNGDLVAFMYVNLYNTDHGQLCATHVVGQGNTNGFSPYGDYPAWKPAGAGGMLQGLGREARLVPVGDIYFNFKQSTEQAWWFQALGYDGYILDPDLPGGDDNLQASSNSFGPWAVYEDGWDEWSRIPTYINEFVNPYTTFFMSSGNTGPGYGTTGAPQPVTAVQVGSSAQFGSTGVFEPIASLDQITAGDSSSYYSRGPSANNQLVPHLTANGGFGTGALGLNEVASGWEAWDVWAGTSRSAPVAMGASTLLMDAYAQNTGRWPDWFRTRQMLMQGANQIGYDPLSGGSGYLNAARSAALAAGDYGVTVTPDYWDVGDYQGRRYAGGFAHIAEPGQVYTTPVAIHNVNASDPVTATVSDLLLEAGGVYTLTFDTLDQSLEAGELVKPDYLFDVQDLVGGPLPSDTVLLLAELLHTRASYAPDNPEVQENVFRLKAYDWTDLDGDGRLWQDADGDDYVDTGEIDGLEYLRLNYSMADAHHHLVTVGHPLDRVHDGLYLGIRHRTRTSKVPTTTLSLRVTVYRQADWGPLDTSAFANPVVLGGGSAVTRTVAFTAPVDYGLYQGAIQLFVEPEGQEGYTTLVPVMASVAYSGNLTLEPVAVTFGDMDDGTALYTNGSVAPIQDWSDGRGTAGEWRFFFLNQATDPSGPGRQARLVARTRWDGASPPADVDTYLLGPDRHFSSQPYDGSTPVSGSSYGFPGAFWGPYALRVTGASESPQIDSGHWAFETATGGNEDYTAGEFNRGLHGVQIHAHRYDGETFRQDYAIDVGYVDAPEFLSWDNYATQRITLTTNLTFTEDLTVTAYGLSSVSLVSQPAQFAPGPSVGDYDACVASYHYTFSVSSDLSEMTVRIDNFVDGDDLDLFVLYDANDDGSFNCATERVGDSGTGDPDPETVVLENPPQGLYQVAVVPYTVGADGESFDLFVTGQAAGDSIRVANLDVGSFGPGDPMAFDVFNQAGTCDDVTQRCSSGVVQVWLDAAQGPVALFDIPVRPRYSQADLGQLSFKWASDTIALPGDVLTYTIYAINTSPTGGTVVVTDVLPSGVEFLAASPGYSYDPVGNRISWSIAMPPGGGQVLDADYDWVDISGVGTPHLDPMEWWSLFPGDDDEGSFTVTLPFTYTFFDLDHTEAYVDANGQVAFDVLSAVGSSFFCDGGVTDVDECGDRIAALFGDQAGQLSGMANINLVSNPVVYTYHDDGGTPADGADDRFIVQWDEWQLSYYTCLDFGVGCELPYPDNTYQVILYPDGSAKVQYAEINTVPIVPNVGVPGQAGVEGFDDGFWQTEGYAWGRTPAAGLAWVYTPTALSDVVLTATVRITDTVNDGWLCNTATLDNGHGQLTPLEDCTLVDQADLDVLKSVLPAETVAGDVVTYTVEVDNLGPVSTTVTITDALPGGVTFGGFVTRPTGITESGGVVQGTTFVTATAATAVVFTATVDLTTTTNLAIANQAQVEDGFGEIYGNGAMLMVNPTDLSASDKGVSAPVASPGDVLTYTITVENRGLYTATVAVEDDVPPEVAFGGLVGPAGGLAYAGGVLSGTLVVGGGLSTTVTYTATVGQVPKGVVIENRAELDDGDGVTFAGPANTTVDSFDFSASLKAVQPGTARAGDVLTYTLALSNAGGVDGGLTITDVLPANVAFGGFVARPAGIVESDGTVMGTAFVTANTTVEVVYTVTVGLVRTGGWAVNRLIIDDGVIGPEPTNETAVPLSGVDLRPSYKTTSAEAVRVGELLTYTVVLSNAGVADGTATVTDALPAGVAFASALPAGASYDAGDHAVTWNGVVTAGEEVAVTIVVTATSASPDGAVVVNRAWIKDGLGAGWTTNQVRTAIVAGELYVTKLVDRSTAWLGEVVTYTVIVRNLGNQVATASITDALPGGLTYVAGTLSVVAGAGTTDDTGPALTGAATLQPGVAGNEVRFRFQATVDRDVNLVMQPVTNTVSYTAGDGATGTAEAVITVHGPRYYFPIVAYGDIGSAR